MEKEKELASKVPRAEPTNELRELLGRIRQVYKARYVVYVGYIFYTLFQEFTGAPIAISWWAIGVGLLIPALFWDLLLLRTTDLKETVTRVNRTYLVFLVMETTFIMWILQVSGSLPFTGAALLITLFFIPYYSYTRRNYIWAAVLFSIALYLVINLLENFGVLIPLDINNVGENVFKNRALLRSNLITVIPMMALIIYLVDALVRKLQGAINLLTVKEKELQTAKSALEIKVKIRTRELEEERQSLGKKVKERTAELDRERKELAKRIFELERFHKLAVGREMKMRELKKEIEKLKKGA